MVSFRRIVLALTVLALFAGLASAQLTNNQLNCSTNVSVTPALRAEGYTEQTGDIALNCTGGANLPVGSSIPLVNIQIFLNTQVTSRLLPVSNVSNNISEALLMIDEPGSGLPSFAGTGNTFGPNAPQSICPTPLTGCPEFVSTVPAGPLGGVPAGTPVAVATNVAQGPSATTQGYNVFQGVVSGASVTFFGVPVLAPVTAGASRVYRITNIRANATTLSGGSSAGATPVIASIVVSNSASLSITNPTPIVGFVQPGLTTSAGGATSIQQCVTQTRGVVNTLVFTENFGTAFKTRVVPNSNTSFSAQSATPSQNIPGTIYNSESNFVLPINSSQVAGLADFGTRLKATFSNIPTGVRVFVSVNNVTNAVTPITAPVNPGGTPITPWATLVNGESTSDGNAIGGFFPGIPSDSTTGTVPTVEVPIVNGTGVAVWEVLNTNPNTIETFRFGVYATTIANTAQNSPAPGTGQVNLSFAPTPTAAFTAAAGAVASSSLPIPRFTADSGAARNIMIVNICRTVLLYPYVTNIQGFDTGMAIANTTTDPFGTGAQNGSCNLNWYQGANNPAVINTGNIPTGTIYTTLASTSVPGFNGYMIAVCNFQLAHGFAFVSDLGARNLAMGYLALVVPDPGAGTRAANPLSAAANGTGENIAH